MLPDTETRVSDNTAPDVNQRIDRQIEANVHHYARRREEIERRLDELDREWDIERSLEFNAGVIGLSSLFLGTLFGRRWHLLTAAVCGFLIQHATQGWCPPVPLMRRLGVRTTREINRERFALKTLRGDFDEAVTGPEQHPEQRARQALDAADFGSLGPQTS